jgi:hypothetical protein
LAGPGSCPPALEDSVITSKRGSASRGRRRLALVSRRSSGIVTLIQSAMGLTSPLSFLTGTPFGPPGSAVGRSLKGYVLLSA